MKFRSLLDALREARWFDISRARAYVAILAAVQALGLIGLLLSARHGLDPRGEPIGTDFVSFWTAARLAMSGAPASVYDPAVHFAAQRAAFGGHFGWYAFFYPPVFLLYVLPLGALSYFGALVLWLGATLGAYVLALRQIAAKPLGLLPILAFPAVLITLTHGQNAFLSTALFAGGAVLLERRPVLAGLLLGAVCYKPQLAIFIPLALAAAGRWRAFFAFGVAALALAGLSYVVFGDAAWRAFFAETALARATLEQGLVEPGKMQSLFAALRLWGAPFQLAYVVQAPVSLAAAVSLVFLLRRTGDARMQIALTVVATLLATPFVLDYDFTLLALPLAVVLTRALRTGFLPYEKILLLAAYMLPGVARVLALYALLPLSPFVLALLFASMARRVSLEASRAGRDDARPSRKANKSPRCEAGAGTAEIGAVNGP
ncbi:DUF2029 domain-containing protein [Rhodoblastus acidophilus]|uniref:DUF2029 domain-containing protein n=1 Tax=Candidatus Rhodoblastus alkanivorans TaxID=2954117 RepID=A0ABS9ZAK5_9HYPH|nr:glycosyltransferase family 87 protein [Candidatus Rhodoblastus alkanivorans]MCI4677773.1 DUF2029 domain-containing protein [Candidatus Rhodoblastus alkanivorans]MCI4684729.1 DUF2029 domain-containing protein [Candidatus Rhodoblastus alkanivorans]MDI4642051.1 DUF2029 domain-containing protein [Rhodoblastus acidophilus]